MNSLFVFVHAFLTDSPSLDYTYPTDVGCRGLADGLRENETLTKLK